MTAPGETPALRSDEQYHAVISWAEDDEHDEKIGRELKEKLCDRKFKCFTPDDIKVGILLKDGLL